MIGHRLLPLGVFVIAGLSLIGVASAAPGPKAAFKPDMGPDRAVAIFAGGCFWCMEEAYDAIDGVTATIDGYTGGHLADPSYEDVTAETSGHAEAVKVVYDPKKVSYRHLLDVFWHNVDPTDDGGQFCDRGDSYRSEIFAVNDRQLAQARQSKQALESDPQAPTPIKTSIVYATTFYRAEDYHQNYHQNNPLRYKFYSNACGRYQRLDELWGDAARTPVS